MKNFSAFATLSDKTIIAVTVIKEDNKYVLTVTVLPKGFYVTNKQYTKIINEIKDLHTIIEDEIKTISDSREYKIIFNF